ncbi:MAG: ATPase [Oscillospiraceae bacterium]|nr:ATPase [Oscillospiraceae bacterium]
MAHARYFLGVNSPRGFYSLYDQLIDPAQARAYYILKGGPGCGKSFLMDRVGLRAEEAGYFVEYIQCSGNPGTVDGIYIPALESAIVDGTAPHVIEPAYPGVVEDYINLGEYYDKTGLGDVRAEIMSCMEGYRDCCRRVYRCLGAASEIAGDMRAILVTQTLEEKASKRAKGIIAREFRKHRADTGRVVQRFLSSVTYEGIVCRFDTVDTLCSRVYEISDSYGLSHLLLSPILSGATSAGYDVIACPSPMFPERLEHLIIPGLGLAFISSSAAMPYGQEPYRHIRMDAMTDADVLHRNRARLRFSKKVSAALVEEAVDSLSQANVMNTTLEALYQPYVNFSSIDQLADRIADTLLGVST